MDRILIYMGHPAHFHLFRNMIVILKAKGHDVLILIKKKDVLEELLKTTGWNYINILPRGRSNGKLSIALALLKRDLEFFKICRKYRPDVMMGTSAEITHIGKLLRITSIVVNEDDAGVVPLFAKLAYPWADLIVAPQCCDTGRWSYKKKSYSGYHELAYLHPKYFQPDESVIRQLKDNAAGYFLLRFAKLDAHHDEGRKGINSEIALKLINLLSPFGKVYISSERQLEPQFEQYRIKIHPSQMLSALAGADLYIGDSQTMAAEAAVLGTPSVRFNDFAGEIGYLEELEHVYALTFGIRTAEKEKLFAKVKELAENRNVKQEWIAKKQYMLEQTTDLTALLVDLAENFRK